MALQRLKDAAERAKIELSSSMATEVNLPFLAAGAGRPEPTPPHHMTMERHDLEGLVEPLIQATSSAVVAFASAR